VALADILERIGAEAAAEAAAIRAEAAAEAERIAAETAATLARDSAELLEAAERDGAAEAATLLANARLEVRDALLAAKRALAEEALERAREALEALPAVEYTDLIARAVAADAAGATTLAIASADAERLAGLAERLRDLGCPLTLAQAPAPLDRGVLVSGDRMRVEVSVASLLSDRREELLLVAADALFGDEG
jgi:vacuolar-type H+-ATPase subunit E/Vma4